MTLTAATLTSGPAPAIETIIVCLPANLPTATLADGTNLDTHLGVPATTSPQFWTIGTLRPWHRSALIGLQPNTRGTRRRSPRLCAGGPIRLLDLDGMRRSTASAAAITHQWWTATTNGTRHAAPWPDYDARHLGEPGKYPLERARRDFENQPRVHAMRAHNAAHPNGPYLDPRQLDALQAGHNAYCHLQATTAICRDALLTETGTLLTPATSHLTDRITYLTAAHHHLTRLPPDTRLLALTPHTGTGNPH